MDLDLSAFHFLRPLWLLGLVPAALLWAGWRALRARPRHSGIAPQLLPYLLLQSAGSRGPRPIDVLAALLALGAVAAAGPTWQRDEPGYLDNVAPLVLAVDLSASMDTADVPPSRLEAVKRSVRDIAAQRKGAKTGLVVYAGTSHLVLPPTDDAALLDLFAQALATDLLPARGRDVAGAIALSNQVLRAERAGGSVLLLTDGADPANLDAVGKAARAAPDLQVLVMAVGINGLDTGALRDLAQAAHAPPGQPDAQRRRSGLGPAACATAFPRGPGRRHGATALARRRLLAVLAAGLAGADGAAAGLARVVVGLPAGGRHLDRAAAGPGGSLGGRLPHAGPARPVGIRPRRLCGCRGPFRRSVLEGPRRL